MHSTIPCCPGRARAADISSECRVLATKIGDPASGRRRPKEERSPERSVEDATTVIDVDDTDKIVRWSSKPAGERRTSRSGRR